MCQNFEIGFIIKLLAFTLKVTLDEDTWLEVIGIIWKVQFLARLYKVQVELL